MSNRVSIVPIGDMQQRLITNTGLVCWHYRGVPVAGEIGEADFVTPVWFFQFVLIEEEKMQDYLIRLFMTDYRMSRTKALEWLCNDRITIAQDKIIIEEPR